MGSAFNLSTISTQTLPGGAFVMGADHGRHDERPAHQVELAPFRAALRPVSNDEYRVFVADMDGTPPPFWGAAEFELGEAPVVGIAWTDALAYCTWLSARTGIEWRLPTEAEREYAARGGIADADWPVPEGGGLHGNWPGDDVRSEIAMLEHPHSPTAACRNRFGLYCMADNVHEWCSDWYDKDWYARSPITAPIGPANGVRRASRGGSWRHRIKFTRVSARSSLNPNFRYNDYGFRVYADAE